MPSDGSTRLVWFNQSMTVSKLMLVKADELRNKCLAMPQLNSHTKDWLVTWVDNAYEDPKLIAERIEIMEAALANFVKDKLDKANGEM